MRRTLVALTVPSVTVSVPRMTPSVRVRTATMPSVSVPTVITTPPAADRAGDVPSVPTTVPGTGQHQCSGAVRLPGSGAVSGVAQLRLGLDAFGCGFLVGDPSCVEHRLRLAARQVSSLSKRRALVASVPARAARGGAHHSPPLTRGQQTQLVLRHSGYVSSVAPRERQLLASAPGAWPRVRTWPAEIRERAPSSIKISPSSRMPRIGPGAPLVAVESRGRQTGRRLTGLRMNANTRSPEPGRSSPPTGAAPSAR